MDDRPVRLEPGPWPPYGGSSPIWQCPGIMRPAMRRTIVILALLAAGGLLVACGSGSDPSTTTVAPAAVTTRVDPAAAAKTSAANRSLTRRQAIAFAHAVNLTAADVPGFKVHSEQEHETAAEKRLEHEMLRCVRALGSHYGILEGSHGVVEMGSKEFGRETNTGEESVQSEVTVVRTPALAGKELAAATEERLFSLLLTRAKTHGV
jgi:hypothetical protein